MLFSQMRSFKDSYDDVAFTPPLLSTIRARTLLVQGDRDECFPSAMAVEIQSAIPGARLWVIPNGEHWPIQKDRIPGFTQTVSEFLDGAWESPQPSAPQASPPPQPPAPDPDAGVKPRR